MAFRRPITVMNKIRSWHKEKEIAAELWNRTISFLNWMAVSLRFFYFIRKCIQNEV